MDGMGPLGGWVGHVIVTRHMLQIDLTSSVHVTRA